MTFKSYAGGDHPEWNISVTPQYMFNNALKMDFERRLGKTDWIGISGDYYLGPINQDNSANGPNSTLVRYNTTHQDDYIRGEGITIDDKWFFSQGFFIGFGYGYEKLGIDYQDNTWVPTQQNGLTYYHFTLTNGKLNINRNDGFFGFGYAGKPLSGIHVDWFLGGGYRTVNSSSSLGIGYRDYTRTTFDFQYPGIHPIFTMTVGYMF